MAARWCNRFASQLLQQEHACRVQAENVKIAGGQRPAVAMANTFRGPLAPGYSMTSALRRPIDGQRSPYARQSQSIRQSADFPLRLARDERAVEPAAEVQHVAAALGRAGRGRGGTGAADHAAADRTAQGPRRRHRLRGGGRLRAEAAARRDGPRPRLRRRLPRRPGDHPPRRDKLLCDRQHRPAAAARGLADARPPGGGRDRSAGRVRRQVPRSAVPGVHPSSAGPADDRRQAGVPLGLRLRDGPGRNRASPRRASRPGATRARPARRRVSWNCSTATTPRCGSWRN